MTLLGIGLGAGLAVVLRRDSTSAAPTIPYGSIIAAINDTSLGAITTLDGNRHIFYQDFTGSLRHILYDESARAWNNQADLVPTSSLPRDNTPIAALDAEYDSIKNQIHVFFIDVNDRVAVTAYVPGGSASAPVILVIDSLSAASGSRTLSTSCMTLGPPGTTDEALLFYEASTGGNLTALRGYLIQGANPIWVWYDVTGTIYGTIANWNAKVIRRFGAPLGSNCIAQSIGEQVALRFLDPTSISRNAVPLWFIEFSNWTDLGESAPALLYVTKLSRPKHWH